MPANDKASGPPLNVFVSYAHNDQDLKLKFEAFLKTMREQGAITMWSDSEIGGGERWDRKIQDAMATADVFIFLVTNSFLNSDFIRDHEVPAAMKREEAGEAVIVPVILRKCAWAEEPWASRQALPQGVRPVTDWQDLEAGFAEVDDGLRPVFQRLRQKKAEQARRAADAQRLAEAQRAAEAQCVAEAQRVVEAQNVVEKHHAVQAQQRDQGSPALGARQAEEKQRLANERRRRQDEAESERSFQKAQERVAKTGASLERVLEERRKSAEAAQAEEAERIAAEAKRIAAGVSRMRSCCELTAIELVPDVVVIAASVFVLGHFGFSVEFIPFVRSGRLWIPHSIDGWATQVIAFSAPALIAVGTAPLIWDRARYFLFDPKKALDRVLWSCTGSLCYAPIFGLLTAAARGNALRWLPFFDTGHPYYMALPHSMAGWLLELLGVISWTAGILCTLLCSVCFLVSLPKIDSDELEWLIMVLVLALRFLYWVCCC